MAWTRAAQHSRYLKWFATPEAQPQHLEIDFQKMQVEPAGPALPSFQEQRIAAPQAADATAFCSSRNRLLLRVQAPTLQSTLSSCCHLRPRLADCPREL